MHRRSLTEVLCGGDKISSANVNASGDAHGHCGSSLRAACPFWSERRRTDATDHRNSGYDCQSEWGNDHDAFGPTLNQRLSLATSFNDNFTDHADNRAAGPAGI